MSLAEVRNNWKKNFVESSALTYRRPTDVIYLALALATLLVSFIILLIVRGALGADSNLLKALPGSLSTLLTYIVQAGSLAAVPVVALGALVLGRLALARNFVVGGVFAWAITKTLKGILDRGSLQAIVEQFTTYAAQSTGHGFPSGHVAVAGALATVADPYLHSWRRWLAWITVVLVGLGQIHLGANAPVDAVAGLALGVVVGALTNLVLGVPARDLSAGAIKQAFKAQGIEIKSIKRVSADARGSVPYFVTSEAGDEYFVKLVGSQQRNADFLFKLYRTVLLKNVASTAPFLTPMQQIEHEAYLSLLSQKNGVRTPDVQFTTRAEADFALLATKRVPGRTILDIPDEEITDSLLIQVWDQVAKLHKSRIYHGDLRLANLLFDEHNEPWVIDFGFAASGANELILAQDTAQMLASMAPVAGAERTVNTALQVLGPLVLREAAPSLKPLALSSATREDLKSDPDFLQELVQAIEEVSPPRKEEEEESVFRIQRKSLLFVIGLGIGVYALLPQLGELNKILGIWQRASPLWILFGLLGSLGTYVAAAISQQGAIEKTLSFWRLTLAQLAATFASRFGPQGLGGVYVNERFIEKSGVGRPATITALTVNAAAGGVVHAVFAIAVLSIVGFSGLPLPKSIEPWQIGAVVIIALVAVVLFFKFRDKLEGAMDSLRAAIKSLAAVLRNPLRAVELFGGSAAITIGYLLTFLVSLYAVNVNIGLTQVAAVYLAGSIIGSASPTPGGLGALEAAFVAALGVFGVPTDQAVAGTLLYRLLTFWLPILPGAFAFRYLQHEKLV